MMVRAKMTCCSATEIVGGKAYVFSAVADEENKTWAEATPFGKVEITINSPEAQKFEAGKSYYVDFSPAE